MEQKNLQKLIELDVHPVVPFDPSRDKLFSLDLTGNNTALTDHILSNTDTFTTWINQQLATNGARYAIGGYAELRDVYKHSSVFDPAEKGEEPRRFHLGTDIWGNPNTPVMAPCDAIIHSFAFNDQRGDYGATIILSHQVGTFTFYTLYGHLSLNSIKNLHGGERIAKGDVFAELGLPFENGSWPPHLHFQLIRDMNGWTSDYPGVCKFSERDKWLANSPDPDVLLRMNRYL